MQAQRSQGRRWVLSSQDEALDAVVEVASVARRSLSIFTSDLEPGIYDSDEFLEVAKRLVLSKPYAHIRALISDPARTARNGNRFVALGRRLNTHIEFRNVRDDYRNHREAYLIADDIALLYRVDAREWKGIADTHDRAVARRYLDLFDTIWTASEVGVELRDLRA